MTTTDQVSQPRYTRFYTLPFHLAEHVARKKWPSFGLVAFYRDCHGESALRIATAKELTVYRKAYALAMRIFDVTKRFPPEERYALTSQLRRSSRSPCRSLREAWAKRRYPAHFVSKLTDADGENGETDTSLDFARDCGYLTQDEHLEPTATCAEIGRMLGAMLQAPEEFLTTDLRPPAPDS